MSTYEAYDVRADFPRWRCATIAVIVLSIVSGVLLVSAMADGVVMSVDHDDVKIEVKLFGKSKACFQGACDQVSTDDVTCGHQTGIQAAAAFAVITLVLTGLLFSVTAVELVNRKEPLKFIVMTMHMVTFVALLVAEFALQSVRNKAKNSCGVPVNGLERYAVGPAWIIMIITQIAIFASFVTYLARRYMKCCNCCCAPPPTTSEAQPVMGQPVPATQPYQEQPGGYQYQHQQQQQPATGYGNKQV